MTIISVTIISLVHWIFAVEYYELALKFEMIMGFIESDIEAQFRRKNLIVFVANTIFYLWQASLTIAWIWMYVKQHRFILFYNLAVISLTASALVLLYSIVRLYREIKLLSHAKI